VVDVIVKPLICGFWFLSILLLLRILIQVVTAEDKVRAINALDFPSHERHNRVAAWQRAFDPSGTEAQSAANNADKLKTHDRRALVDLEFLDHLVAMQVILLEWRHFQFS